MLPFARYRLRFELPGEVYLPDYPGSAWRGAFGHALLKTVCVTQLNSCARCLLYRSCPYPYIFDTPPPEGAQKMRKYSATPHPFVLETPHPVTKGHYDVGLTLIGRAAAYLPYFIHSFQRAGEHGLGKNRVAMTLVEVSQAQPADTDVWERIYEPGGVLAGYPVAVPPIPAAPASLRLRFETPLRLRHQEHLVTPEAFGFSEFFGPLLRRVSMLSYFHTDAPLETDFAGLMDEARQLELHDVRLCWKDWTRYSSRQKRTMQMGGLLGEVSIRFAGRASPLWPYVWIGQWIHAGKGTSMGLGQYTIEPQPCRTVEAQRTA